MWKLITIALNNYLKSKYPNIKGTILIKSALLPTKLNAFKERTIDVYYHIPNKNKLLLKFSRVENIATVSEGDTFTAFLEQVFSNLKKIEDEIVEI